MRVYVKVQRSTDSFSMQGEERLCLYLRFTESSSVASLPFAWGLSDTWISLAASRRPSPPPARLVCGPTVF